MATFGAAVRARQGRCVPASIAVVPNLLVLDQGTLRAIASWRRPLSTLKLESSFGQCSLYRSSAFHGLDEHDLS